MGAMGMAHRGQCRKVPAGAEAVNDGLHKTLRSRATGPGGGRGAG